MPDPVPPPETSFLEAPLMFTWLISTIALLATAALWWRHGRRGAALGCVGWFAVSVAAGWAFLGDVPRQGSTCGSGGSSPTIAFADVAVAGEQCRTTARFYVAAAAGVIAVSFAIVAGTARQRWRKPAGVTAAGGGAPDGPGSAAG